MGYVKKDDAHAQRVEELRRRVEAKEPLFRPDEAYEVSGGTDESKPDSVYRPGDIKKG